jgi:hypothetical protein
MKLTVVGFAACFVVGLAFTGQPASAAPVVLKSTADTALAAASAAGVSDLAAAPSAKQDDSRHKPKPKPKPKPPRSKRKPRDDDDDGRGKDDDGGRDR